MILNTDAREIEYIDTRINNAAELFCDAVYHKLLTAYDQFDEVVIICIGSDRSTGDSLGPITGYKLAEACSPSFQNLYGTLESPVHAKNLAQTMQSIHTRHPNPLIIAVDASLGRIEHIGCITLGFGPINPGAGIHKQLPPVGDIFITGIVNLSGGMEFALLQNTRLALVMKMAEVIAHGLLGALSRLTSNHATAASGS